MLKQGAVILAVLLLGAASIRSAAVAASSDRKPGLAEALWRSHPKPTLSRSMAAIGAAAALGQSPPESALAELRALACRDPLLDEPFTVAGTAALAAGDAARADRLLREAMERNPRAFAPRYLAADLAFRSGNVERGLDQVLALTRLLGPTVEPIVPGLSTYARQPGAVARLRPVLSRDARLRDAVLIALAADPSAADIALALAGPPSLNPSRETSAWQTRLLDGMITRGEYGRAYRTWQRLAGLPAREGGLFNPEFRPSPAPPPFNWQILSGSQGLAEPLPDGGLSLVYYGRDDAVLASQVMVLGPGSYHLSWVASGPSDGLEAAVTCLRGNRQLAAVPLVRGSLRFSVPPGCAAQRLEFRGALSDMVATVEPTLTRLALVQDRKR